MRRAPAVLTGTALGLAGVVGFHASSSSSSAVASGQGTGASQRATTVSGSSATGGSTTGGSTTTRSSAAGSTANGAGSSASSGGSSGIRTAAGQDVPYQFGDLEVKVTMSGSKITDVQVVKLNVSDPRSQSIDQYAIPQLRSEALSAQSARLDGVSGASYTSQAYEQSLQSALDKLAA